MIVHGRATSSNVQAVMWVVGELGLDHERRDVGGRFGGNDAPEFRAISPFGLVPALEDGDVAMFEAPAICRYLLGKYDKGRQFNTSPWAEAWGEWCKWTLSRAFVMPIFWGYFRTAEVERDMDRVMADFAAFETLCATALAAREGAPWLGGDRLSLGDIWFAHVLYRYFTLDLERQPPEGLIEYYAACRARPAYRTHVMVPYAELAP
ncbi:MAG: glutathione S-transferase N-terminal domain-containing protein [Pseudomonadota bacterium]